jgi:hypothetical protein
VIVDDPAIAGDATLLADPQPIAVEVNIRNQDTPAAEPVAEPVQEEPVQEVLVQEVPIPITEADFGAAPERAIGDEQEVVEESESNRATESAGPIDYDAVPLDAITPLIIEHNDAILDPQPEGTDETTVSPPVESTEPVDYDTVVPGFDEEIGSIPELQLEVVNGPVEELIQEVGPEIEDDAATGS